MKILVIIGTTILVLGAFNLIGAYILMFRAKRRRMREKEAQRVAEERINEVNTHLRGIRHGV